MVNQKIRTVMVIGHIRKIHKLTSMPPLFVRIESLASVSCGVSTAFLVFMDKQSQHLHPPWEHLLGT